jgi:hypothetical protein
MDTEQAIRWPILLMVLCRRDPVAAMRVGDRRATLASRQDSSD